MSSDSMIMND